MLTPGNKKLGGYRIWGFGIPSGSAAVCVGLTPTCRTHCYAVRTEQYRSRAAARYRRNLILSQKKSFVRRVRALLVANAIRVVRIHTSGEFYSARYIRNWHRIIRRSPRVKFFFYTRSWRVAALKPAIDALASLSNCQAWYSADRDTGIPVNVPQDVRVAWLMVTPNDVPPAKVDLVFRTLPLRRVPAPEIGHAPVCPAEDGIPRPRVPTCDRCGICWRPPTSSPGYGRIHLPVVAIPSQSQSGGET